MEEKREKWLKAMADREAASKKIVEIVQNEFPVGMVVDVLRGGCHLTLEIVGHGGSWWYSPGLIHGRNIKTGKVRNFTPDDIKF